MTNDMTGPHINLEEKRLDLERYKAQQIRDRFTPEMLDEYLRNFGIQFFSPDFYNVPQPTYLISKEGPCAAGLKEYSLEEARTSF